MADAVIDRINPADLGLISHLYNSLFRPTLSDEALRRTLHGRTNVLAQVARIGSDAVGFLLGMERQPGVFFVWTCGVATEMRRAGIGSQLFHAAEDWARTEGYRVLRFECDASNRGYLHFGVSSDFTIVGTRWDSERMQNVVIFEKALQDAE